MITLKSTRDDKNRKINIALVFDAMYLESTISRINTKQNGSWLYPVVIDNFVNVITTDQENPVVEVIKEDTEVTWELDVLEAPNEEWDINFIKFELIDKKRRNIPTKRYWTQIFELTNRDMVCPDGSLYIRKDKEGIFSIKTKEKLKGEYLLKYSVDFVNNPEKRRSKFYKIDPVVRIRPH